MNESSHTITLRAPSPDEQRRIEADTKLELASYLFLVVFLGVGPALVLGWIGGWIGSHVSVDAATIGRLIGWFLAAMLLAFSLVSYIRYDRRMHERAMEDARACVVQEITVSHPRVIRIGLLDADPVLAFDLGGNKVLILLGQWLIDPGTYGAEDAGGEFEEGFVNGLPAPYSFPSAVFTLVRSPNSGRVLAIRVTGEYLAPERSDMLLDHNRATRESELLDGSLEQIGGLLGDTPRRRRSPK